MKDVMIDLETFGSGSDACIVQIGACFFDRYTGETGDELELNVDARSSCLNGGKIDADTVYWWLRQEKAAVAGITRNLHDISAALTIFSQFLHRQTDPGPKVWSHATFDWPILATAYKNNGGLPFPAHFKAARDVRTICDIAGIKNGDVEKVGVAHTALADCKYQIAQVALAFERIRV